MKVSEVIDRLEKIKEKHGDLKCVVVYEDIQQHGEGDLHNVAFAKYTEYDEKEEPKEVKDTVVFVCDYSK